MADVADEAPSRRVRHAVLAAIERCGWGYQGGNISFPMGCQGIEIIKVSGFVFRQRFG